MNKKQHSINEDDVTEDFEDDLKDLQNEQEQEGFPDLDDMVEKDSNGSSIIHEEKDQSLPTNDFSQMLYSHNPVFTEPD